MNKQIKYDDKRIEVATDFTYLGVAFTIAISNNILSNRICLRQKLRLPYARRRFLA